MVGHTVLVNAVHTLPLFVLCLALAGRVFARILTKLDSERMMQIMFAAFAVSAKNGEAVLCWFVSQHQTGIMTDYLSIALKDHVLTSEDVCLGSNSHEGCTET